MVLNPLNSSNCEQLALKGLTITTSILISSNNIQTVHIVHISGTFKKLYKTVNPVIQTPSLHHTQRGNNDILYTSTLYSLAIAMRSTVYPVHIE